MRADTALVWFRRDLRSADHTALHRALTNHARVHCAFVLDPTLLGRLAPSANGRVDFLLRSLADLDRQLRALGGGLTVVRGEATHAIPELAATLGAQTVYANRDYEPWAIARDETVQATLAERGIAWQSSKDQVVFERDEVLNRKGTPFAVFTPYKNAWLAKLTNADLRAHSIEPLASRLMQAPPAEIPTLAELGFAPSNLDALGVVPGSIGASARFTDFKRRIDDYHATRDFPAVKGPSYLSPHLRFGTISIRELVRVARARGGVGALTWLSELIWREFYFMVLAHHPHVIDAAYKSEFDRLEWNDDPSAFQAWCAGQTGFPIVDAAMRQLNTTGYMHNRLRMVVASFLTKDLHIDWRWGERYFGERLIDYDLALNNGGWQWAASTGCDGQPYFRIFNPVNQSQRFDPDGAFIRRYVPELAGVPGAFVHAPSGMGRVDQIAARCTIGREYPAPITDHARARGVALARYAKAARKS